MLLEVKYIKTKDDDIIVFPASIQHKEFGDWQPKSAGFIVFGLSQETGNPICKCYGESISLGLKSHEEDTKLAQRQLNLLDW